MNLPNNLADVVMLDKSKMTKNKTYDREEDQKSKHTFRKNFNEENKKIKTYAKLKKQLMETSEENRNIEGGLKQNNIKIKEVELSQIDQKKTVNNTINNSIKESQSILNNKINYGEIKTKSDTNNRVIEGLNKVNSKFERNEENLFTIRTNKGIGKEKGINLLELKRGYKNLKVEVKKAANNKLEISTQRNVGIKTNYENKEQGIALSLGTIIKEIFEKTTTSSKVNLTLDAKVKLGEMEFKIQDLSKFKVGKTNQINILLNIDGEKVRLVAASNDSEINIKVGRTSDVIKERIELSIREIRLENRNLEISLEMDEKGEEDEKEEKRDDQSKRNREKEYKEMRDQYEFRKRVEEFGFN